MPLSPSSVLGLELEKVRSAFPKHIDFIDHNGITVFQVYGNTGGISTESLTYLVRRGEGEPPQALRGGSLPLEDGVHDYKNGWKIACFRWQYLDLENGKQREMAADVEKVAKEII